MEMQLQQVRPSNPPLLLSSGNELVQEAQVIDVTEPNRHEAIPLYETIKDTHPKQFIEANTKEVNLYHLKNDCIVPVFSKDNEITISHSAFIETVWDAVGRMFRNETIAEPDIRVFHIIKGRTPEAIHKSVGELTDHDKTIY